MLWLSRAACCSLSPGLAKVSESVERRRLPAASKEWSARSTKAKRVVGFLVPTVVLPDACVRVSRGCVLLVYLYFGVTAVRIDDSVRIMVEPTSCRFHIASDELVENPLVGGKIQLVLSFLMTCFALLPPFVPVFPRSTPPFVGCRHEEYLREGP